MLCLERWYPLSLALMAGIVYFTVPLARTYRMPGSAGDLMSAVINLCAISIGFLATTKSILIAIDDKPLIADLKKTGYYQRVVRYLRAAITWSFLLACASAVGLLLDIGHTTDWTACHAAGMALWFALAVGTGASCYRVVHIFYTLLDTL